MSEPSKPVHVPGTRRGEEEALEGHEPGRAEIASTIEPRAIPPGSIRIHGPDSPGMPSIPPA